MSHLSNSCAGKWRAFNFQTDLHDGLRQPRRLGPAFDIEDQDRFLRGVREILFQTVAILRDKAIGSVDNYQPPIAPHRDGQQLIAHRLELRLFAGEPGQTKRFLVPVQNLLHEPLEDGPLQMPLLTD